MAARALSSEGAEMQWIKSSPDRDHLMDVIRQLISDLGITQEIDSRISKLHALFTSATRSSGEETRNISGRPLTRDAIGSHYCDFCSYY